MIQRLGTVRSVGVEWVGYKVHLTETCDDGQPHLITQVLTTPAIVPDCVMGPTIHHNLAMRDLLPGTHLLYGRYVDAELLVTAHTQHQIDVVGPPFGSDGHQRRAGQGYDLSAFAIDWEAQQARCPQGQTSIRWTPGRDVSSDPVVRIRFHAPTCRACPVRPACTQAKDAPRQLTDRPVCLASAGSLLVSGHARQGRRIMRRPVRAILACRQDPDLPGAAPERAAAEIVACRCVVPVWPRYREDGLRP